jgi:uncharacterized membrane protein
MGVLGTAGQARYARRGVNHPVTHPDAPPPPHATVAFRRGLAAHLPLWVAEGTLTESAAEAFHARYQLDALGAETRGRFWAALYIFGAALIGLGVIALVASSWPFLPAAVKVGVLLGAMLLVYALGYRWRHAPGNRPGLGLAMELLGVLFFGANIGLFGQIFHLSGSYTAGFGTWALGATAMAYATGCAPVAVVALIAAFNAFAWEDWGAGNVVWRMVQVLGLALVGVPFAFWHRSVPVFALTLLGVAVAYLITAVGNESVALLFCGMPALGLLFFASGVLLLAGPGRTGMARAGMILGVAGVAVLLYVASFLGFVEGVLSEASYKDDQQTGGLAAAVTVALALLVALAAAKPALRDASIRPLAATMAVLVPLLMLCTLSGSSLGIMLASNGGLVVLGGVLIWTGVAREARSGYWGGVLLLALLLLTRFMEYDTGLLMKGLAFIAAGLAVLYTGAKFEGYLDRRRTSHAS